MENFCQTWSPRLLSVLRIARTDSGGASGAAIARELEQQAGRRVSRGALYTTLDRLEGKGLLRWKIAIGGPERGALPRRAYAVTARGMEAVRPIQGQRGALLPRDRPGVPRGQ